MTVRANLDLKIAIAAEVNAQNGLDDVRRALGIYIQELGLRIVGHNEPELSFCLTDPVSKSIVGHLRIRIEGTRK